MNSFQKNESQNSQESSSKPRRYHIELSPARALLCSLALVLGLVWMFVFGVLIGRGIPVTGLKKDSLKADLIHFLGLDEQNAPASQNVAETWTPPEKMQESLTYYQDLTKGDGKASLLHPKEEKGHDKSDASARKDILTRRERKDIPQEQPSAAVPSEPADIRPSRERATPHPTTGTSDRLAEHYTLLVGSLKDAENAEKLVEQLKAKGYETRMEPLDLSGSGRWNRVLVGTFESREAAMNFAVDFNRKERMQGLVIRESN